MVATGVSNFIKSGPSFAIEPLISRKAPVAIFKSLKPSFLIGSKTNSTIVRSANSPKFINEPSKSFNSIEAFSSVVIRSDLYKLSPRVTGVVFPSRITETTPSTPTTLADTSDATADP